MERIDPRTGIGHPDPDDVAFYSRKYGVEAAEYHSIHGCDGACSKP